MKLILLSFVTISLFAANPPVIPDAQKLAMTQIHSRNLEIQLKIEREYGSDIHQLQYDANQIFADMKKACGAGYTPTQNGDDWICSPAKQEKK